MGVLGSTKLGIRIVQAKGTEGIAEQFIGFTDQIRKAFEAISAHFQGKLKVRQGRMEVIEGGDTALVIMETWLDTVDESGIATQGISYKPSTFVRNATPRGGA